MAVAASSCARLDRRLVEPARVETLDGDSAYLKIHMTSGDVYLLTDWQVADDRRSVSGVGERFDANRKLVKSGWFTVSLDAVALFETNVTKKSKLWIWLTVVTGASVAMTIYCLENSKACFGSCPTFYASDGAVDRIHAEAFSASVAPALEARDVDALYRAQVTGRQFELRVTNEALETHVIRRAHLLAVEKPAGGRVFATRDGRLFGASELQPVAACDASEGSCVAAVAAFDAVERVTVTDPHDLATRETIAIELDPTADGIVIAARQTFVTTYLFYTALAYMGTRAGEVLASLSRLDGDLRTTMRVLNEQLGQIDVEAWTGDEWKRVGAFAEAGPIATDVQLVVLPTWARSSKLRLHMAQGHWRIDWIAGASLTGERDPVVVPPSAVQSIRGADPDALSLLLDSNEALTTLPGDEYTLVYQLPELPERYELFLDAKGYYLEWMRKEWIDEENVAGAALLLLTPDLALKWLAPKFKRIEPLMEQVFWNSRYAAP
jgi:hypothetical protein